MQNKNFSKLKLSPKSKVLQKGYINIYSKLSPQEKKYIRYNTLYKKTHPHWDNTQIKLLSYLDPEIKKNTIVLDAGCGNGNYLLDERREKIDWVVGVDAHAPAVRDNICVDELLITDLQKLDLEKDSFDIATSLWVIEHLSDPLAVFTRVRKALKPGAKFIFSTPNKNYFLINAKRVMERARLDKKITKKLYGRVEDSIFSTYYKANTKKILERTLYLAGFKKVLVEENFDPGYTSFNQPSFQATQLLGKLAGAGNFSFLNAHLVGWAQK